MKTQFNKSITVIVLMAMYTSICSAQDFLGKRDSLPILKPKPLFKRYQVKHQGLQELSISSKKPKRVDVPPKRTSENFLGGALTFFTGVNTGSSTTSLWMMPGELACEGNLLSWNMPLYFQGRFLKDRERVKNEDGSYSIEVSKALDIDWDQESYGFIYENRDTIGYFSLITNLLEDSVSHCWLPKLEQEGSKAIKKANFFQRDSGHDFKISLALRKRAITVLSLSAYYRTLVLIDGKPAAFFQSDPDYIALGKANRLNPYILFVEGISDVDKADLIRLSLLTSLIRNIVSEDLHQM